MAIDVPRREPALVRGYVGGALTGSIPQSLAMYANWLQGCHFLKAAQLIVAPYRPQRGNYVSFDEVLRTPFTTTNIESNVTSGIMVFAAVSNVNAEGYVQVEVREAPEIVSGVGTPGSGDLLDPGIRWDEAVGTLPRPVHLGRWLPSFGPQWVTSGSLLPPEVDPGDPVSTPRTLSVPPGTDVELVVSWDKCALNTVVFVEFYREKV